MLLFVDWNVSPEIFHLGEISIRYYGLLFAIAFVLGYKVEERMFKSEGLPMAWLDKLWLYVAIATIIGARLGHCIFYDWAYYSQHPLEMILPFRFTPDLRFTGFQGLASHGAAIGIIAGLWYYSRKVSKKSIFWILDRAVIPIALAGVFIRTGNLMNSEIFGIPTGEDWGFRFIMNQDAWMKGVDPVYTVPVHPTQIYEAVCYLVSFLILMYLYWRTNVKQYQGYIFGMFLILIFTARFVIEFWKEVQEPWEAAMTLNMGQWLSIPFVVAGIFMLWYSKHHKVAIPQPAEGKVTGAKQAVKKK